MARPPITSPPSCEKCGSNRVNVIRHTRHFTNVTVPNVCARIECRDCGHVETPAWVGKAYT